MQLGNFYLVAVDIVKRIRGRWTKSIKDFRRGQNRSDSNETPCICVITCIYFGFIDSIVSDKIVKISLIFLSHLIPPGTETKYVKSRDQSNVSCNVHNSYSYKFKRAQKCENCNHPLSPFITHPYQVMGIIVQNCLILYRQSQVRIKSF